MNLKYLFQRRQIIRELKIVPVEREVCRLRLQEWRSDKQFVSTAAAMLSNPNLKMMMDCCWNEHPAFEVLVAGTQLQDRAVQQARAEGYTLALANLEALGKLQSLPERIAETFEPETKDL